MTAIALQVPPTDATQQLVERCLKGDRKASYEFYRLYSKAMFNVTMRIVADYDEAQDVLQEVFVKAFRNLHTFRGDSTLGAWLKRITVHTSLLHLRQKKQMLSLDEKHEQTLADLPPPPSEGEVDHFPHPPDAVRRAIQLLPEGYRVVLSLYLLEGYDHAEIAEVLGISEGTSKSQYNRAKARLRQILDTLPTAQ